MADMYYFLSGFSLRLLKARLISVYLSIIHILNNIIDIGPIQEVQTDSNKLLSYYGM